MTKTTKRALVRGSFWVTATEVLVAIIDIARQIVAARVLSPSDIGLMGIALLYIAVLDSLSKTGFDQALIQKSKDIHSLLNVAWTWHVMRGFLLAGLLAFAAPWLADWYELPVLRDLIWASCIHVVLIGLHNIGLLLFTRDLNFRTLFIIGAIRAATQAGVAIPAIIIRQDVWGLLLGTVAGTVAGLIISYIAHPFRPRFEFSVAKARELTSYGKWITVLAILLFIIVRGDDLLVSRWLGPTALAFYIFAYDFANLPTTKICHVLGKVAFPTYSRMQDEPETVRSAFVETMRATLLLSTHVSVVLWVIVHEVVAYVVGEKWRAVVPLVRILVLAGWIRSFAALAGPLFQALKRPDLDLKMNLPRFIITASLMWPAIAWWGLEGVSWVVVVAISSCSPTWFYGVKKLVGVGPGEVVRVNAVAILSSAILVGCFAGARHLVAGGLWGDLGSVAAGLVSWAAVMLVLEKTTPLKLLSEIGKLRKALK
ncbi:MAG: lipopolysaccharide biosynthesis protein [Deltaproteobacteria bacterium]|nr:lipopolysaccharide biosynthesis protein [Deltaproteobacteria bacterium]